MMKRFALCLFIVSAISLSAQALTVNATYVDGSGETWTSERVGVIEQAIADWEAVIADPQTIEMTFDFSNAGTGGYLGHWTGSLSYYTGDDVMPWYSDLTHTISFNVDLFSGTNYLWWDGTPATDDDQPFEAWDALSVARHELGHALGYSGLFKSDYGGANEQSYYDAHVTDTTFDPGGLDIELEALDNLYHVAQSYDNLMSPALVNGIRRDIAPMNLDMLSLAYGYDVIPEPASMVLLTTGGAFLLRRRCRRAA